MNVGKQSTLNDLENVGSGLETLKAEFEVVKQKAESGSVGTVIEGSSSGELGRGARSFGIASFFSDENAPGYLHIKTVLRTDSDSEMFHIRVSGYAYGESSVIDSTFVGYCYAPEKTIHSVSAVGTHLSNTPPVYVTSDGYVAFRLKFISTYYLTLVVDSMRVGNGRLFRGADIQIIKSEKESI